MEVLLLFGLVGVIAFLWHRVDTLQRSVRRLEDGLEHSAHALRVFAGRLDRSADLAEDTADPDVATEEAARPIQTPPIQPRQAEDEQPAQAMGAASAPRYSEPLLRGSSEESSASETEITHDPRAENAQEEQPATFAASYTSWRPTFDFEDIFGRLLPIWAGGIALAVAGFFLVRWSIENGLLDESVRVSLGFGFGAVLLAAAELAHRFSEKLADPRVRQALAGAGLATLYASFYLAGSFYDLIGGEIAFAGLAGVTALAIALSYRFGLPSAVLGLVGGFAAPALAGASEPNLPMLATYLALITGGLVYTGRKQERSWLGLAALAGGLGWGALMLVSGPTDSLGIAATGGYLVLVGAMLPALMGHGTFGTIGRLAASALATIEIAALVDISGYSLLAWGAYVLLACAIAILGWRNQRMREAGGVAAALSVCLIAAWPDPAAGTLAGIGALMAAIFVGVPLAHVFRREDADIDWGQLTAYPLALIAALCLQLWVPLPGGQHTLLGLAALVLAAAPAAAAWFHWPKDQKKLALRPTIAFASAAICALLAGLLLTPGWVSPLVSASAAALSVFFLRNQRSSASDVLLWGLALTGALLQALTADTQEFVRLIEGADGWMNPRETLRALAASLPFALLVAVHKAEKAGRAAQLLSVAFAYGALAQSVPAQWLPALIAGGVLLLARRMDWGAAHAGAMAIAALWAAAPLGMWAAPAMEAFAGVPMLDIGASHRQLMLERMAPLALAWLGSMWLSPLFMAKRRKLGWMIGGGLALVLVHGFYKAIFGISDAESFIALAMAERTIWQAAIGAAALACLTLQTRFAAQRAVGIGLAAISLAHFGWFTMWLHNPLWDAQATGAMPLLNWLLPAYGTAIALVVALRGLPGALAQKARPVADAVIMVLIAILTLSELRHAFSGSILNTAGVSSQEDLLRSLLAIALALAFLAWGSWRKQRSWRIGSLVLMLLAVSKVFVFDAAGLEGLARIASFMALGLCLIGIGWFYSRQLKGAGKTGGESQDGALTS